MALTLETHVAQLGDIAELWTEWLEIRYERSWTEEIVPPNRRDMLKTLRGELISPYGDRVYLYRPCRTEDIPADAKGITYAN